MLLRSVTAHVPAQEEMDADWSEYGHLGIKTRAAFGGAAVDVGTPDRGGNDDRTDAVDVIANVLHWLADVKPEFDARPTLDAALTHYLAEVAS